MPLAILALDAAAGAMTKSTLIQRAQEGDEAAFAELTRASAGRVMACATKMLGPSEAEDAAQESFLRAWRALDRFDGRAAFSTWLHRICVNVCLNRIRKRKSQRQVALSDESHLEPAADSWDLTVDPVRTLERSELQTRLRDAIGKLSPSLRAAVALVLIEGVTHADAAESLGVTEGTISWRIHEARKRLREELLRSQTSRLRSVQ